MIDSGGFDISVEGPESILQVPQDGLLSQNRDFTHRPITETNRSDVN